MIFRGLFLFTIPLNLSLKYVFYIGGFARRIGEELPPSYCSIEIRVWLLRTFFYLSYISWRRKNRAQSPKQLAWCEALSDRQTNGYFVLQISLYILTKCLISFDKHCAIECNHEVTYHLVDDLSLNAITLQGCIPYVPDLIWVYRDDRTAFSKQEGTQGQGSKVHKDSFLGLFIYCFFLMCFYISVIV